MFYVTDFNSSPKDWFLRLKLHFFGENPRIEFNKISGVNFGIIKGVPKGNRDFFTKVKRIVGEDVLIFQDNFDILERNKNNKLIYTSPAFTPPDHTEYYQRLLVDFALKISKNASKLKRLKVLLIDIGGHCTGVCIELLKVVHNVTVLTNNPSKYDTCIRYANQSLGTTPTIIERGEKINNISFILAPYGLCGYIPHNSKTPVLSIKNSDNGYCIFEEGILVENKIKEICPKGVSPTLFSSQIFIEKGYSTMDSEVFLRYGNRCFTVEEIIEILT